MAAFGIWFTQGYSNLFQAMHDIRRADVGKQFKLICSHPHPEFVGGQAADINLVEPPRVSEAGYLKFVLNTVAAHNVRVIFPSRQQAFMNKYASVLAACEVTVATVASTKILGRIDNKGRLYRFLDGKQLVRLPEFHCVKGLLSFNGAYRDLKKRHSKVCIKPTVGVYGSGFRILKSTPTTLDDLLDESLEMGVEDLRARLRTNSETELMVMQYLEGDERSVDCLAFGGKLIGGVVRCKSSSSVAAQIIEDRPDLIAQVKGLVKALQLNGMFNVQFKDTGGVAHLLEINPRLSGRSYYATLAGLNIPYLAARLFSGLDTPEALSWTLTPDLLIGNASVPVPLDGVVRTTPVPQSGGESESR